MFVLWLSIHWKTIFYLVLLISISLMICSIGVYGIEFGVDITLGYFCCRKRVWNSDHIHVFNAIWGFLTKWKSGFIQTSLWREIHNFLFHSEISKSNGSFNLFEEVNLRKVTFSWDCEVISNFPFIGYCSRGIKFCLKFWNFDWVSYYYPKPNSTFNLIL